MAKLSNDGNNENVFEGMLFAVNEDYGLTLRINASPLDERQSLGVAVLGLTAAGFGEGTVRGVFGPLPVPYNSEYRSIVYVFSVKATKSNDPRTMELGRFCALFLVFRKKMIRFVINSYRMIESMFIMFHDQYWHTEDDLKEESLQIIYEGIIANLKYTPQVRVFRIEGGVTTEFEDRKVVIGEGLTVLVNENQRKIFIFHPKKMDAEIREKLFKALDRLNRIEYQSSFEVVKIPRKRKFLEILGKNNIPIIES